MKAITIRAKRNDAQWRWEVLFRGEKFFDGLDSFLPAFHHRSKLLSPDPRNIRMVTEWLDDQGVEDYRIENSSVLFRQAEDAYLCLFHFMECS